MYYRIRFSSEGAIYTTTAKANQLLLRIYLQTNNQGGSILDYTLLPNLLDLLIYLPRENPQFGFIKHHCSVECIHNTKALLIHYSAISRQLPLSGKDYPFCGTYEAYHGSNCLSSLGKMGPFPQEISIGKILKVKRDCFKRLGNADRM